MALTKKQNHLKRLLQEYVAVLNASDSEELSEITMEVIDVVGDFDSTKINVLSKLMEEAATLYSEELEDMVKNKDGFNPLIQQLIDNSNCKYWF